jgi:hypothetical protein
MKLAAYHARLRRLVDTFLPTSSITGGLPQECLVAVQEALDQDLVSDQVLTCHKDLVTDQVQI